MQLITNQTCCTPEKHCFRESFTCLAQRWRLQTANYVMLVVELLERKLGGGGEYKRWNGLEWNGLRTGMACKVQL